MQNNLMQNNVKLSRAYYGTDWILSLFWINLKGFEIYIKSIIGEFFSAAWLMRFQENQLKPAQISSNFNNLSILSQLWQSRSRIPGPKCLLAVPDDPPRMPWFNFDESERFHDITGASSGDTCVSPTFHESSWALLLRTKLENVLPDNAKKVKFVQDLIK